MKKFRVVKHIEVKDFITQAFLIEAESEQAIADMTDEEFYEKCSFGEILDRAYGDTPTGYEELEKIEEVQDE